MHLTPYVVNQLNSTTITSSCMVLKIHRCSNDTYALNQWSMFIDVNHNFTLNYIAVPFFSVLGVKYIAKQSY